MDAESLEQMQARHRRELKELQGRITSKKKNATKKTRKGVNDECEQLEKDLRDKQAEQIASVGGGTTKDESGDSEDEDPIPSKSTEEQTSLENATSKIQISSVGKDEEEPQGQGKKRNRQKERLARRAAEQEAAIEKAEQEASQMTDHRARESTYMKNIFKSHNLVEQEIAPDGHCLFSAVADQLSQNGIPISTTNDSSNGEPKYKIIRKSAARYMLDHGDDFAPFLEEDLGEYVVKMRDTAEWGGQLELVALAKSYGVEIRVVQDGNMEKIGEDEGKNGSGKVLWLAYYRHGYGLGEHYNSLRQVKEKK